MWMVIRPLAKFVMVPLMLIANLSPSARFKAPVEALSVGVWMVSAVLLRYMVLLCSTDPLAAACVPVHFITVTLPVFGKAVF